MPQAALIWAVFALAAPPPAQAAAQPRQFEDFGTLTDAAETDDGVVWLKLWTRYARYRVPKQTKEKREALVSLLNRANDGTRGVTVRYDGAHGRLNLATGTLDYSLCAITLDDLRFEPDGSCPSTAAAEPRGFEPALALAQAEMSAGDQRAAEQLLTGLEVPREPAAQKLFLRVRAENRSAIAAELPPRSAAADQAAAAALADYRALAALEPDDVEHRFAVAEALIDLGGYPEARGVYEGILAKWPDEEYRIAVRLGALLRVQGHYAEALQSLNDLVARRGPQVGMKFHYHRAWTLSLLGRHDEAIRELSEGIKEQPDYSSAYQRRACAYAAIGDAKAALADAEEAARLLALLPAARVSKGMRGELDEMAALRARLKARIVAGDATPLADACSGASWHRWEQPRPRSPLLPVAG